MDDENMLKKWEDYYLEEHPQKQYDNNYQLELQDLAYQDKVDKELMDD